MIEAKKLDKINKGIFLVALFCTISRKYINYFLDKAVPIGGTLSYLLYLSLGLFLLQFLINKNRSKRGIIFLIISSFLFVVTGEGSILALTLMGLGMEVINEKFAIKSYFSMHVILFVGCVIFVAIFPDIGHRQEMHYRIVDGYNIARYSFGSGNPNSVLFALLPTYTAYIYLRFDKYNMWDRILIGLSLYVVYINTNSRTGLISIVAGLVVLEILKVIKVKESKIVRWILTLSPVIMTLASVGSALFLHKNKIAIKLLSSRTMYWHLYIREQGSLFNLFGNDYPATMRQQNPIDNSYIYIISILGMVTMILLLIVLCKGLSEYAKRDMKKNIIVVIVFLIFAFGENMLIDAGLNFALALLIKDVIVFDSETVNIYKYPFDLLRKINYRRKI
ncbi:MAG: hypothetical protein RRZ84_01565 [Romboutsia sp.]